MTCTGRCDALDELAAMIGSPIRKIKGRHGWFEACACACLVCAIRFKSYPGLRCPCCRHQLRRYMHADGTPTGRSIREKRRAARRKALGADTAARRQGTA